MKATVLSNIAHYHHLAAALEECGVLDRYLCNWVPINEDRLPRWVPRRRRRKLEGRRLKGVPSCKVTRFAVPEMIQRLLPMLSVSHDRADQINNELLDYCARAYLPRDIDVFHFVSSIGFHSASLAKQRGARIVCDVRQEHPDFQRQILQDEAARFQVPVRIIGAAYEKKVLAEFELADFLVVPSSHCRRTFVESGFSPERITVNPYGVDALSFCPRPARDGVFRIVYVGTLNLRKGVVYLLEAYRRLRLPNSELVIAGPIDPAFRPVLSRYEGLFTYREPLAKAQVADLLASSSVFVLPSLADSFSLATLEAMSAGIPVIISENTGAADVVEQGKHGYVVPIRDADALMDRINRLRDRDLAEEMGKAARTRALAMSWQAYKHRIADFYRSQLYPTPCPAPEVYQAQS